MDVLLSANSRFLQACVPFVEDGRKIVKKIIVIFKKEDGIIDRVKDLGLELGAVDFEAADSEKEKGSDEG